MSTDVQVGLYMVTRFAGPKGVGPLVQITNTRTRTALVFTPAQWREIIGAVVELSVEANNVRTR